VSVYKTNIIIVLFGLDINQIHPKRDKTISHSHEDTSLDHNNRNNNNDIFFIVIINYISIFM
jgi:hypothetical protein